MKNNPWMQIKSSFAMVAINPLSAKITKWSNTLKQFVGNLPTNCLSVFDHLVGLVLKGLRCSFATLLKLSNKRKKTPAVLRVVFWRADYCNSLWYQLLI